MAQVPPPPHADGKKILFVERVESSVDPGSTSNSVSPLMVIFTFPCGDSFARANKSTPTKSNITTKKNTILMSTTVPVPVANNVIVINDFD
jgi:hypothetical protein